MSRTAVSPAFNPAAIDHGGNEWIPAIQARTAHAGWDGETGITFSVIPGTRPVPLNMCSTTYNVHKVFANLWGQQTTPGGDTIAAFIKPHLSALFNWFSPFGHRGATQYGGYDEFEDRGYYAGTPQHIDSPGLLDPIPAGRGLSRSRWSSDIMPVFPAQVPLVRKPATVSGTNRRGGRGYVMPNPLARIMYPLYVQQNVR